MARESDLVPRVSEIAQLPADIDALHVLVAAARAERDAAIVERDHALSQIDRLRHLLRQLQRAQFGRRSEKLDPEQLLLALEDIEQAIAGNEAADDKKDPVAARARSEKRRANRGALPIHLPHVDVTIEPEDTNCPCCRAPMHVIGEETSQRLDVIPAQFRVVVTHRPKYACRACEQAVVQAPAPERLIKGGLPTEAMVAYVLVAKRGCGGVPAPKLSKRTGAAETVRGGPVFRIEWAAQLVRTKKTRLLTQLVAVLVHSRRCFFGRSNKQCEQSDHAHSDNQHCKCYGIVVQPIQPLLHDTPPCFPTPAEREDPGGNASGRLAFPIRGFRPVSAGSCALCGKSLSAPCLHRRTVIAPVP